METLKQRVAFPPAWLSFALIGSLLLLGTRLHPNADLANYMLYLHSFVFDQDLFLANNLEVAGKPIFVSSTGYPFDIHNLGVALFWLPFYVVAQLIARLSPTVAAQVDGFDLYSIMWLKLADWFYGLLALHFCYLALQRLVPRRTALFSTLVVAVGSSFGYYMGPLTPSTHMVSAFLAALFLYAFLNTRQSESPATWRTLGIVGSLALTIANTNVALLALPVVYFASTPPSRRWLTQGSHFALAYLLAFLPQMVAWYLFTGNPFKSPYGSQLSWLQPHLLETLFSPYHGLYFYAPLLLLATVGLCLPRVLEWRLALGSLLALGVTAYLSSINLAWWAGGSFGARYFIGMTPFFALGLAALVESLPAVGRRVLWGFVALSAFWTLLLYLPLHSNPALSEYYPLAEHLRRVALTPSTLAALAQGLSVSTLLIGLLLLPLFILLALWLWRQRRLPGRVADALFSSAWSVVVPLVLLALIGVALLRSPAAKARCEASQCDSAWIHAEVDQWDLAHTYAERARYHERRGEHEAALADMEQALQIYPADPKLQQWLEELRENSRDLLR
ncbi:MAG: hypothetical protein H0T73_22550 [Ardenticatenales bacterium]|nr:hypothetical protein [Ardenticatenales bacterium]